MNTRPDNPNDKKPGPPGVNRDGELRQQLWELAYGLLEPQEAAALIARVKSDAGIARLYAEVKLQTDLVSTAARVDDSSLAISAQAAGVGVAANAIKEQRSDKAAKGSKSSGWKGSRAVPAAKAAGAWGTNWLAVAGTTALLLLLGYGLWQPTLVTNSLAKGEFFYTRVTGLAEMTEGITQKVGVEYQDIHNHGRAAELEVRLVDQQGQETYRTKVRTADDGRAEVNLPGPVLKKGVRLEVSPAAGQDHDHQAEMVSKELQIADEQRKTIILTERPYAEAGESNRFQMFGIGVYSKSITPPATDELMVEKQSGGDVVRPMWTVDPASGMISGEYELPKTYSADEGLAMRRRGLAKQQADEVATDGLDAHGGSKTKANEPRPRMLRQSGTRQADAKSPESLELQRALNGVPSAERAKAGLPAAGLASGNEPDRNSQQGGSGGAFGGGQPGAAQRPAPAGVAASPPSPPPAPGPAPAARPRESATADASANRKNAAAAPGPTPQLPGSADMTASKKEGRGADKPASPGIPGDAPFNAPAPFPIEPNQPGEFPTREADQQKAQQVAKQESPPAQKPATLRDTNDAAITAETEKLSEARRDSRLGVEVPDEVRGEDLVLIARADNGKVVARQELSKFMEAKVRVDLPPEVNGQVDVELFRKGQFEAPVLRQQVVHASARRLDFEVSGLKAAYAPGEQVRLSVRVLDEQGRPVAAAASVRVWNDVAARAAGSPLLLAESLTSNDLAALPLDAKAEEVRPMAPVAAAPAAEVPAQAADAAGNKPEVAAFGAAPAAADPSEIFFVDNRSVVQQKFDRAQAIQEIERAERTQSFGRVLIWSGAGLMLLIGVLLIARRPLKSTVWVPAVGLAVLSLGLGVTWFLPPAQPAWQLAKALPDETGIASEGTSSDRTLERAVLPAQPTDDPSVNSAREPELPSAPVPHDAPTAPIAPIDPNNNLARGQTLKQLADPTPDAAQHDSATAPAPRPPRSAAGGNAGGAGQGSDRAELSGGGVARKEQQEKSKTREPEQLGSPGTGVDKPAVNKPGTENKPGTVLPAVPGEAKALPGPIAPDDQPAAKKSPVSTKRDAARGLTGDEPLPDSLFWRPLSPVSDGTFTIEFTMPAAESDYRLLIDAIGSGRIGGKDQLLRCRSE